MKNNTQKQSTSEDDEKLEISRLGREDSAELKFNAEYCRWFLVLDKKYKKFKICCYYCEVDIKDGDKIYFCPNELKFMHKECCLKDHHPKFLNGENEHEDFWVDIKFGDKNEGTTETDKRG